MQKEIKNYAKHRKAFTLVELILASAMIAILAGALVGIIYNSYRNWKLGCDRSTLLQDSRAAMEQMTRILRQAKGFISVSSSTDPAGQITFTDVYDVNQQFSRNAETNEIQYGQPASLSALTGSVSSLVFTCYDINDNNIPDPVQVRNIRGVGITATLIDPASSLSFTLSDRVFCQGDSQNNTLVINEIMYNPMDKKADEWVELYNLSSSDVNLTGWEINNDTLIAHPTFGNGSMIIPSGGYAVIMTNNAIVFNELTIAGDFENKNQWQNNWTRNNWDRTNGDAHNGNWKGESTVDTGYMYTDISVPANLGSCPFIFWEKTTATGTQITATIHDMNNHIPDDIIYSGQMNSTWTRHTKDITAFAGQHVRIYFNTNKTGSGSLFLDDISVASSYVSSSALILSCGDNQIGNGLGNNGDTVTITDGSATIDSVTYDDAWGGDGNGKSLARIDPQGGSDDPDNWQEGDVNGTPGWANP